MALADQLTEHYAVLEEHLLRFFPEDEITVFEEVRYWGPRMDVFRIRPAGAGYQVLLTSGMSTWPMEVPEELEDFRFAELAMVLPRSWEFSTEVPSEPEQDWPVTVLKQFARFPTVRKTFVGVGHTILFSEHFQPFHPSVDFVAGMLIPSVTLPEGFNLVEGPHGPIHIYSVFPLYRDEWAFKQAFGYDELLDLFIDFGVRELVLPGRPNVVRDDFQPS